MHSDHFMFNVVINILGLKSASIYPYIYIIYVYLYPYINRERETERVPSLISLYVFFVLTFCFTYLENLFRISFWFIYSIFFSEFLCMVLLMLVQGITKYKHSSSQFTTIIILPVWVKNWSTTSLCLSLSSLFYSFLRYFQCIWIESH